MCVCHVKAPACADVRQLPGGLVYADALLEHVRMETLVSIRFAPLSAGIDQRHRVGIDGYNSHARARMRCRSTAVLQNRCDAHSIAATFCREPLLTLDIIGADGGSRGSDGTDKVAKDKRRL